MSKGYPDYFGYSMFPSYGQIYTFSGASGHIASGDKITLADISFKGQILGGIVSLYYTSTASKCKSIFTIDGQEILNLSLPADFSFVLNVIDTSLIDLTVQDAENNINIYKINSGLPVESNYKIEIDNVGTDIVIALLELHYTIIKT